MDENRFYNVHTFTYYSLLESTLSVKDIINFSINHNLKYVVICDNNLSCAMEFYHEAKKQNLEPVIGLDFNFNNSHYLLIAKNNTGYHQLLIIESLLKTNKLTSIEVLETNQIYKIHLGGAFLFSQDEQHFNNQYLAIHHATYKNPQDLDAYLSLQAIKQDSTLSQMQNEDIGKNNYLLDFEAATKIFSYEQINNTKKLIEQCQWTLPAEKPHLPKFKIPNNFNSSFDYLKYSCLKGLKQRLNTQDGMIDKVYIDRLDYELSVINDMGFCDYFLIVSDFINYAKSHDILIGPGRGSAAGSLVSYCMNITEVDPIKYDLIFERFLNVNRKSLPDIDIDVMDTKRQLLIDYIFDKYGPECTSYISTFQKIKAKMAIRDIGRILGIDIKIIDKVTKNLTPEMEDDLTLINQNEYLADTTQKFPLLFELAQKIINIPRQISTHAAGIIIADKNLNHYIPITIGIDEWQLSEFTMEYLEPLGLFKIDILGLKNLSIIAEVIDLIWTNKGIKIDLNKLDLNDMKLFDEITSGNTIGIFQLESTGMKNTIMRIKPRCIEDISICSALFRPGPQSLIPDFVKTRNNQLAPVYINEQMQKVLEPTLGFCIYQEQVMELIRSITNFDMAEADIFRRAISKKKEDLFDQMKDKFIKAAMNNHYTEQEAIKNYQFILEFAHYGFNHSHSLSYSLISYQMMYLKYYYPLEFFVTLLKHGDSNKHNLYISELRKKGIKIYNIDIRYAQADFSIYEDGIMFGLLDIKGFGQEIVKKIINAKLFFEPSMNYQNYIAILFRKGVSLKNLEVLIKIGAFDNFNVDRNFLLINLDEIIKKSSIGKDKLIFDLKLSNDYVPMSEAQKEAFEFEYLSFSFSNNQWLKYFDKYQPSFNLKIIPEVIKEKGSNHTLHLIKINQLRITMTKYNKRMCFIEFEENNSGYSCANFNESTFEQLSIKKYYIVDLTIESANKIKLNKVIEAIEANDD